MAGSVAALALVTLTSCEQVAKVQEVRAKKARADELDKIQEDSNAKVADLRKALGAETWGRPGDYDLQRAGTEVRLWQSMGEGHTDVEGRQLGSYCVLNAQPRQPGACDAQRVKIGRLLLEIEEEDKRFYGAMDELRRVWK